jgi:hypothetical protein
MYCTSVHKASRDPGAILVVDADSGACNCALKDSKAHFYWSEYYDMMNVFYDDTVVVNTTADADKMSLQEVVVLPWL